MPLPRRIKAGTRKPIIMKLTNYPLVQRLDLAPVPPANDPPPPLYTSVVRFHPLASPIDFPTRNLYPALSLIPLPRSKDPDPIS